MCGFEKKVIAVQKIINLYEDMSLNEKNFG